MNIKSTWRRVTRQDVLTEFESLIEKAHNYDLWQSKYSHYTCAGLYTSNRKTRNIGVCYNSHSTAEWCIVLNAKLLNCPMDKIRQILVHEIAHACCPKDHHGYLWQYTANKLGREWGYEASRLCYDEEIIQTCGENKPRIYAIRCPKCGTTWKYKIQCRAVKYPNLYIHRTCGCHLERVE